MKLYKITNLIFLTFILILLTRCQKEEPVNTLWQGNYIEKGNLLVSKNPYELTSKRIIYKNELVPIVRDKINLDLKSTQDFPDIDPTKNYAFKLMAEVASPVFEGNTLQATHVTIKDDFAFVTYNTKGPVWQGAVEIFDVSDLRHPSLVSSAILPNADVSAIDYFDGVIYIVGATGDYENLEYNSPAFLEVINLDENMNMVSVDTMIDISSYAGTDVKVLEDKITCTSGSDGGLTVFDFSYNLLNNIDVADARSLDANSKKLFVLQGHEGNIKKYYASNLDFVTDIQLNSSNAPGPKSEIAVNENYIFAAMNEGGLSMLNMDGSIKQHIPRPETPEGGLDENNVTNSVSLNDDLVLIGNGESGVHVGGIVEELNDSIWMMGSMQFSGYASTNFVESKDSVIFVAAGLEGLKIISISIDEGVPDGIIPTEPCSSIKDNISDIFSEGVDIRELHKELFYAKDQLNIFIEEETELYITFIDEGANWKNTFGYYTYSADNPPTNKSEIEHHIIFPNASKIGSGGGLEYGDQVQIGSEPFPAGTVVGFYLTLSGWYNGMTVEGVYNNYTDTKFNISELQQATLFSNDNCGAWILTFEEKRQTHYLCDHDFNDLVVTIQDNNNGEPNSKISSTGMTTK